MQECSLVLFDQQKNLISVSVDTKQRHSSVR